MPSNQKKENRFAWLQNIGVVFIIGNITFFLGLIVILGWIFDIDEIKRLQPKLTQMKANTAFSFLLFGSTLLAIHFKEKRTNLIYFATFTAGLLLIISSTILSEFLFHWESGINTLLFADHQTSKGLLSGQMTFGTALSFFLLATTLLFILWKKYWYLSQLGSLTVLLIAFAALASYMFIEVPDSLEPPNTMMAVHTAFGLFCGAFGVLMLTSQHGWLSKLRSYIPFIVLIFAIFMMAISGFAAYLREDQEVEMSDTISTNIKLQKYLDDLSSKSHLIVALEYGYVLQEKPHFLSAIVDEKKSLATLMNQIHTLNNQHFNFTEINQIEKRIIERIALVEEITKIAKTQNAKIALAKINEGKGEIIDAQLKELIFYLKEKTEKRILHDREKETILNSNGIISLGLTALSGIALLLIIVSLQQKQLIERGLSEAAIHTLAFYDPLTKLPNRRMLLERLARAINPRKKGKICGALLYLDLDNFKSLNDIHGHQMGDELLICVANRLNKCVRTEDTIARLGGDEFIVLVDDFEGSQEEIAIHITQVAEKIIRVLTEPYLLSKVTHQCSASIGISIIDHQNSDSAILISQADIAMYAAKHAGKNTFRFFDIQMQHAIEKKATLESELKEGIRTEQFQLHYQVQVDSTEKIMGAEALIRWQHPTNGFIPPNDFIPFAEKTGLILELGEWVLDTACAQLAEWKKIGTPPGFSMSVNISAQQFYHENFIELIKRTLNKYQLQAGDLKLEITESMLLNELDIALQRMNEIKSLGVLLSMDDFGTGYSSLSYLKELPFDQIKIDRSFVHGLQKKEGKSHHIISSIIGIGKAMDMTVITEGVESEGEVDIIKGLGCQEFQGYFFGRPICSNDFIKNHLSDSAPKENETSNT